MVSLKNRYMLRKLLVVAMFIVAMAAYGVTPQEAVGRFAQASGLPHGSMAVLVTDLSSGKVLASYNAELPLTPASIMKCVTLASLSEVEDVEKSISTPVTIDGKIDHDGILHGNLVIVGQGDPSLNSRIWPESEDFLNEILKALRDRGIRSVEGSIVVDDSFLQVRRSPLRGLRAICRMLTAQALMRSIIRIIQSGRVLCAILPPLSAPICGGVSRMPVSLSATTLSMDGSALRSWRISRPSLKR